MAVRAANVQPSAGGRMRRGYRFLFAPIRIVLSTPRTHAHQRSIDDWKKNRPQK
jgi:hypothetical protein